MARVSKAFAIGAALAASFVAEVNATSVDESACAYVRQRRGIIERSPLLAFGEPIETAVAPGSSSDVAVRLKREIVLEPGSRTIPAGSFAYSIEAMAFRMSGRSQRYIRIAIKDGDSGLLAVGPAAGSPEDILAALAPDERRWADRLIESVAKKIWGETHVARAEKVRGEASRDADYCAGVKRPTDQ